MAESSSMSNASQPTMAVDDFVSPGSLSGLLPLDASPSKLSGASSLDSFLSPEKLFSTPCSGSGSLLRASFTPSPSGPSSHSFCSNNSASASPFLSFAGSLSLSPLLPVGLGHRSSATAAEDEEEEQTEAAQRAEVSPSMHQCASPFSYFDLDRLPFATAAALDFDAPRGRSSASDENKENERCVGTNSDFLSNSGDLGASSLTFSPAEHHPSHPHQPREQYEKMYGSDTKASTVTTTDTNTNTNAHATTVATAGAPKGVVKAERDTTEHIDIESYWTINETTLQSTDNNSNDRSRRGLIQTAYQSAGAKAAPRFVQRLDFADEVSQRHNRGQAQALRTDESDELHLHHSHRQNMRSLLRNPRPVDLHAVNSSAQQSAPTTPLNMQNSQSNKNEHKHKHKSMRGQHRNEKPQTTPRSSHNSHTMNVQNHSPRHRQGSAEAVERSLTQNNNATASSSVSHSSSLSSSCASPPSSLSSSSSCSISFSPSSSVHLSTEKEKLTIGDGALLTPRNNNKNINTNNNNGSLTSTSSKKVTFVVGPESPMVGKITVQRLESAAGIQRDRERGREGTGFMHGASPGRGSPQLNRPTMSPVYGSPRDLSSVSLASSASPSALSSPSSSLSSSLSSSSCSSSSSSSSPSPSSFLLSSHPNVIVSQTSPQHFTTPSAASRVRQRQAGSSISPTNHLVGRKVAPCNCKKSRCLKLYCECFASGNYCNGCNCSNCANTRQTEGARKQAIAATLERNPNAFQPKIQSAVGEGGLGKKASAVHNTGCHCKKSACLKKYCECYQAGITCSAKCKCQDCKNYVGSAALAEQEKKARNQAVKDSEISSTTSLQPVVLAAAIDSFGLASINSALANRKRPLEQQLQKSSPSSFTSPLASSSASAFPTSSFAPSTPSSTRSSLLSASSGSPASPAPFERSGNTHFQISRVSAASISNKKMKPTPSPRLPIFGDQHHRLSKPLAINVFTYLTNDDLYNASLVNRMWTTLALDGEIWQYD